MFKIFVFSLLASSVLSSPIPEVVSTPFLINGTLSEPGQFPYLAHISYYNASVETTFIDSAVLISERYLLAKAEFLVNWGYVQVILGSLDPRGAPEPGEQWIVVGMEDVVFPNEIIKGQDLAIIRLPTPAIINERVKPAVLPRYSHQGMAYVGWDAKVVGWTNGPFFPSSAFVDVQIAPLEDCVSGPDRKVVCVPGHVMSGGDNGAPLISKTSDGDVVIGIFSYLSFISRQGEFIEANGFVRINEQLDFIARETGIVIKP